jgi:hypothetical protein
MSQILVTENDLPDDLTTPDHRPVMAVIESASEQPSRSAGTTVIPTATSTSTPAITSMPTTAPTFTPTLTATPVSISTAISRPVPREPSQGLALGELSYDGEVPDVESDEFIEIINTGAAINLTGWVLRDDDGRAFSFPSYTIDTNMHCRVYTNEIHPDYCGFSFGSGSAIWANSGDQVDLVNPAGIVVDTACWKSGCQ